MRRILLLVAAIVLCLGLGSCQVMTEEEIQAAYDEAFAAGAASVDVTSLLEDAKKSEDLERQLEAKRTEGYAEGFDRGYKAGYENGKKDGSAEAGKASEGSSSSAATQSGGTTSSSSEGSGYASQSAVTVYVTDTGSKYHSYGCQYLRESCHGMTLYQAKQAGYTACSRCDPPA